MTDEKDLKPAEKKATGEAPADHPMVSVYYVSDGSNEIMELPKAEKLMRNGTARIIGVVI